MSEDLATMIDRRYRELLEDAELPACEACGRKPMSAAQTISALAGAARWLASKITTPDGHPKAGSGFEDNGTEEGDDG